MVSPSQNPSPNIREGLECYWQGGANGVLVAVNLVQKGQVVGGSKINRLR